MEVWILVTLGAATAQTLRFMLQKHLRGGTLSTAGSTFARFVYSFPLVALIAWGYGRASGQTLPVPPPGFWPYAVAGGLSQIIATMCVVALFTRRNFAVGITFKKTEVLLAALVGLIVLGEGVSRAGLAAILIGLCGVLLLSEPPRPDRGWLASLLSPSAGLGLASGVLFAVSGVGYRGASLALPGGDALLRATTTLACVTLLQTLALGGWLLWRERGEMARVLSAWRVAGLVGVTSMIGSICWFTAFTLQTVAYVKAVGQAELILSVLASTLVFREAISRRELVGIALLLASILLLVLTL